MTTTRTTSVLALFLFALGVAAHAQDDVARIDSDTDRMPSLTVIPDYPAVARRDRIEGSVQVCFNISRRGYPRRIAVRHSTSRVFEKVAKKAVRKSTWLPLPASQELSGIKACRTFRFTLVPLARDPQGQASASPLLRALCRS